MGSPQSRPRSISFPVTSTMGLSGEYKLDRLSFRRSIHKVVVNYSTYAIDSIELEDGRVVKNGQEKDILVQDLNNRYHNGLQHFIDEWTQLNMQIKEELTKELGTEFIENYTNNYNKLSNKIRKTKQKKGKNIVESINAHLFYTGSGKYDNLATRWRLEALHGLIAMLSKVTKTLTEIHDLKHKHAMNVVDKMLSTKEVSFPDKDNLKYVLKDVSPLGTLLRQLYTLHSDICKLKQCLEQLANALIGESSDLSAYKQTVVEKNRLLQDILLEDKIDVLSVQEIVATDKKIEQQQQEVREKRIGHERKDGWKRRNEEETYAKQQEEKVSVEKLRALLKASNKSNSPQF